MDKKKALLLALGFALFIFLPHDVFAEIEHGKNFDQELIGYNFETGQKTFRWIATPEKILNDNAEYVSYIFTNHTNYLQVETQHGSIRLDKATCAFEFYPKGRISDQDPLFTDSIIARMATNGTDDWSNVGVINNATCQPSWDGSILQAKKTKSGTGSLFYRYINTGSDWKTELKVINLSAQTNKKFAFTQTINLNRDTIKFGNTIRNIDEYDNQTFDRNWIETHDSKLLDLMNGLNFDFDLAYEKLWAISVYNTGADKSKLSFDFARNSSILSPNESRTYDPTFGFVGADTKNAPQANVVGGIDDTSCNHPTYTVNSGGVRIQKRNTGSTGECGSNAWQWDLSSIPDGSTLSNSTLVYDVTRNSGSGTCDITQVTVDLTTATGQEQWEDVVGVTTNTDYVSDSSTCVSTGNNKSVSLGSTFNSFVASTALTQDRVALGMFFYNQVRDGTNESIDVSNPELELVYTTAPTPNAVTDLTATATGKTTVFLDWTQPNLNTGTLEGYQINYTTPLGSPTTVFANNTLSATTESTVTGLTACTPYSFRVSAWTENGNNATGNIANATTSCFTPPSAPTLSATAESDTTIRLTSVNGTTGDFNIAWYGLRCVENSATSWSTIVSNATVPNPRVYLYSGLTPADTLTCQWRDGSAAGWSPWSNNATASPSLDVLTPQRPANYDRLTKLAAWFDSMGGVYMGMSLFPFLVMMIGLLARPRTTHIFAIITLCFMGIIHASGYYVYPDWYWTLSLLFGLVIVLAKKYT